MRRDGTLLAVPAGSLARQINYGRGLEAAASHRLGDVSTAYYSTGIPNIEVYFAFPRAGALGAARHARPQPAVALTPGRSGR